MGPIDKLDIIFELLGGSPHDLLLPRNFLIVEGKSEYELLMGVIRRHYPEQFEGIKISFAGGDLRRQRESIEAVDKTLRPLVGTEGGIYRDRLVVLLDKPNTSLSKPTMSRSKRDTRFSSTPVVSSSYLTAPWKSVIQAHGPRLKMKFRLWVARRGQRLNLPGKFHRPSPRMASNLDLPSSLMH